MCRLAIWTLWALLVSPGVSHADKAKQWLYVASWSKMVSPPCLSGAPPFSSPSPFWQASSGLFTHGFRVATTAKKEKKIHAQAFQTPAHICNVPLAKASLMAKPRFEGWRSKVYLLMRGRQSHIAKKPENGKRNYSSHLPDRLPSFLMEWEQ